MERQRSLLLTLRAEDEITCYRAGMLKENCYHHIFSSVHKMQLIASDSADVDVFSYWPAQSEIARCCSIKTLLF